MYNNYSLDQQYSFNSIEAYLSANHSVLACDRHELAPPCPSRYVKLMKAANRISLATSATSERISWKRKEEIRGLPIAVVW